MSKILNTWISLPGDKAQYDVITDLSGNTYITEVLRINKVGRRTTKDTISSTPHYTTSLTVALREHNKILENLREK